MIIIQPLTSEDEMTVYHRKDYPIDTEFPEDIFERFGKLAYRYECLVQKCERFGLNDNEKLELTKLDLFINDDAETINL